MARASKSFLADTAAPALTNLFDYPIEISARAAHVTGFDVRAIDGSIGCVEAATYEHGRSFLVVDTGAWIVREKRLLPAGIVRGVNWETRKLFIGLSKDEVRHAPDHDEERANNDDRDYLKLVAGYYEPWAPGLEYTRRPEPSS